MKTLFVYTGKMGSGKFFQMSKHMESLKTTGNTIYLISFADPIKQILRDSFGLIKEHKLNVSLPEINKLYIKDSIVNNLYLLIKELKYDKFNISERDLKNYITAIYEKYEDEFCQYVFGAVHGYYSKPHSGISGNVIMPVDYSFCFRRLAQMLGTELGRGVIDSIWVDISLNKIKSVFKNDLADYAFIDDCRFINEMQYIQKFKEDTAFDSYIFGVTTDDETRAKRRGLTIDELKKQDDHSSEKDIDEIINSLPKTQIIEN